MVIIPGEMRHRAKAVPSDRRVRARFGCNLYTTNVNKLRMRRARSNLSLR